MPVVASKDQASSVECPETMTNPCHAQFELVELMGIMHLTQISLADILLSR